MIIFLCDSCQARFDVTEDNIGKQFLCSNCQQPITVPETSQIQEDPPAPPPETPSASSDTITFYCGACQARFDVPAEKIGKQFLCSKCHQPVTVPSASQPSPFPEPPKPSEPLPKGNVRRSALQRAIKRKKTDKTLIYGSGLILLVVLGIIVFFATRKPPSTNNTTDSDQTQDSDNILKELQADKWLQEATARFSDGATPYKETLQTYKTLLDKVKGTRAGRKLEKIVSDLQSTHESEAQLAFQKIQKEIFRLKDDLENTETPELLETYKAEIKRRWNDFPAEYEDTIFWEKTRQAIKETDTLSIANLGNTTTDTASKKLDPLSNVEFFYDEKPMTHWKSLSGKWGSRLDKIVGIAESAPAQLQLGDLVLKNFKLQLEFKIIQGTMAIWARLPQQANEETIHWNSTSARSLAKNQWISLEMLWIDGSCTLELEQKRFSLLDAILPSSVPPQGPLALGCLPNSEVHFRNVILTTTHRPPETTGTPPSDTTKQPDSDLTKQPTPPPTEPPKLLLPGVATLHGKWKQKDSTYTGSYDFSQDDQLDDFQQAQGKFSIKERSLVGSGKIWLKHFPWTQFTLNFDMKAIQPPFDVSLVLGLRDSKNYMMLQLESEWLSINFIECESDKSFAVDQSVALYSYMNRATNEFEIKVQEKSTEIRINGNLAFKYTKPIPAGFVGFFSNKEIRIEKFKITGTCE